MGRIEEEYHAQVQIIATLDQELKEMTEDRDLFVSCKEEAERDRDRLSVEVKRLTVKLDLLQNQCCEGCASLGQENRRLRKAWNEEHGR